MCPGLQTTQKAGQRWVKKTHFSKLEFSLANCLEKNNPTSNTAFKGLCIKGCFICTAIASPEIGSWESQDAQESQIHASRIRQKQTCVSKLGWPLNICSRIYEGKTQWSPHLEEATGTVCRCMLQREIHQGTAGASRAEAQRSCSSTRWAADLILTQGTKMH